MTWRLVLNKLGKSAKSQATFRALPQDAGGRAHNQRKSSESVGSSVKFADLIQWGATGSAAPSIFFFFLALFPANGERSEIPEPSTIV